MAEAFNEYVIKIASGCNLRCSYCYEYSLGDQTWRDKPAFLTEDIGRVIARRIRQHSLIHGVKTVYVSFHGGEPFLAGAERIDSLARIMRQAAQEDFELFLTTQTNAMFVTKPICEAMRRHEFGVSVSLDGGRIANDRHRRWITGKSSYDAVLRGIEILQRHIPDQPSGLLAVIDVRNDPIQIFDDLARLGIKHIDFLLPHYNWERLPPRYNQMEREYGQWYLTIFDAWIGGRHPELEIRFFNNIVRQFVGHYGNFEAMNLEPVRLITVNTAGEIETVDTLKSTGSGMQTTGLNVFTHSFDDALRHPLIAMRQSREEQLCAVCRSCAYGRECSGGYFPHRYSSRTGFNNPSVYCADLYWLLEQVEQRLCRYRKTPIQSATAATTV